MTLAPSGIWTAGTPATDVEMGVRDGTTDLERTDVEVRDVAELLADATGAWQRDVGTAPPPTPDA